MQEEGEEELGFACAAGVEGGLVWMSEVRGQGRKERGRREPFSYYLCDVACRYTAA